MKNAVRCFVKSQSKGQRYRKCYDLRERNMLVFTTEKLTGAHLAFMLEKKKNILCKTLGKGILTVNKGFN